MSLFVCSKCGCIDNTATSYYWALMRPCKNRIYDKSLKGYEGKPVDCPLVDDRPRVLKSNGRKKQEKRGGIGISEAAKSLV